MTGFATGFMQKHSENKLELPIEETITKKLTDNTISMKLRQDKLLLIVSN